MKHSFEECNRMGEKSLSTCDLPKAYEWFYKASKIAVKQHPQKVFETAVKLGDVSRRIAEEKMKNNNLKGNISEIRRSIKRGVTHLLIALKYKTKTSSGLDLAAELGKMKDFFNQVGFAFCIINF